MTAPTTDDTRPADSIRDAFEAILALLQMLIARKFSGLYTPAVRLGVEVGEQLDITHPHSGKPLLALRDLIQRAAEEHNRRAGYFVRAATGTLDGDDADDAASYRAAGDFTPERIREARERCERATPGPWLTRGDALLDDHIQIKHIENGVTFRIARVASFDRTAENAAFVAHAREDLPAALAWGEQQTRAAANCKALLAATEASGREVCDKLDQARAEIERLTAELAARAPADASLEARDAMTPIGDAFARLGKHLETAHRCMNGVHVCDIEEQEEAIKAAVAAYAEIQTVRARYADASDIGKRAYLALDAYRASNSWLAVVRAVDASRPAAAIERTLNINALARCARAALRIEVPDVVAWEALPEAERVGWRAVVRCILASTTLASRPGLTEEQARRDFEAAIRDAATKGGPYCVTHAREAVAALDASRGETGPAPTGLTSAMHAAQQRRSVPPASAFGEWPDEPRGGLTCPGCYDATGIAQPHDPRATLRAGDPASPFAPGSLAAGSATEDRILDRKRGGK